jgi:hypothetical protein
MKFVRPPNRGTTTGSRGRSHPGANSSQQLQHCFVRQFLQKRMADDRAAGILPAGLQCVVITGALPSLRGPLYAVAGEMECLRGSDEDLDPFCNRAAREAAQDGQRLMVIGGFPSTQAQQDMAMAAYDDWLASDSEVPPCETSRPSMTTLQRSQADR